MSVRPLWLPSVEELECWANFILLAVVLGSMTVVEAWGGGEARPQVTLWWAFWLFLVYGAIGAVALVSVSMMAWAVSRPRLRRWGLAALGVSFLLAFGCAGVEGGAFRLQDSHRSWLETVNLWGALAAILGVLMAVFPGKSKEKVSTRNARRSLAALGVVLGLGPLMLPPVLSPTASPAQVEILPTNERFLLIGLDGASWTFLAPLINRGALPNLARLQERGAWGPLKSLKPSASPLIWTSLITGRRAREHGILGHTLLRHPRVGFLLPRFHPSTRWLGFNFIRSSLRALGLVLESPPNSSDRRVPAYWTIASSAKIPVNVVGWWVTWPAEAVEGQIVSDRTYYWRWALRGEPREHRQVTFPESLYEKLSFLLMKPEEVTFEHAQPFMSIDEEEFEVMKTSPYQAFSVESEFQYYYSMFMSYRRIAGALLQRERSHQEKPADLLVLFRFIDLSCHSALRFSELVEDNLEAKKADVEKYQHFVTEAYRAVDQAVGELVEDFGAGNIVIVSDHGFQMETDPRREQRWYNHETAPDGVFIGAGPAFGQGPVEGLEILDLLPMLLRLKGLPLGADLERPVPRQVFSPDFLARHPEQRIRSWDYLQRPTVPPDGSDLDPEMMDRLRAVGYID